MPKRKAGAPRSSKAPARQPPPLPSQSDDDDGDFCEVINPPSASPNSAWQQPSAAVFSKGASTPPAPPSNSPFPLLPSQSHRGPQSTGMLSVIAGLSGAMPYIQPGQAAKFGFQSIQMQQAAAFFPGHPYGFEPAPDILTPQAGFHGRGLLRRPPAFHSAASSSGGMPEILPPVASVRPRVREGLAAQEVKEEPDDTALRPTEAEAPLVAALRAHGVPTDDAVLSLRQNGHDFEAALGDALDTLTNRNNSWREDMARLESEKEKERVVAIRRHEDMTLTVLGDIQPRFQESLLLDKEKGCATFRRAIEELCSGEKMCTPALCCFREKAVKLLFLERNALKWFHKVEPQVRGYFQKVIERLNTTLTEQKERSSDFGNGKAPAEKAAIKAPEAAGVVERQQEKAETLDPLKEARETGSGSINSIDTGIGTRGGANNQADTKDSEAECMTAFVKEEVEALERVLFMLPKTSGGVPDAFLECSEHATLEIDGVEEVCHQSAEASRSKRSGSFVVINIDDD